MLRRARTRAAISKHAMPGSTHARARRRRTIRSGFVAALTLLPLLAPSPTAAQAIPAPPQSPASSDGVELNGAVRVPAGAAGFVDPASVGFCRYVANANSKEVAIPISVPEEWQYFRAGQTNGQVPPGVSEVVCCRPATTTLCQGASGGTVTATITGSGANGYAVMNGSGSATATCSDPPYGAYQDARNFICGQTGSGANADGQWSQNGSDVETCTSNSYVTYGGCSQSCSINGSVGHLYESVYNSCGQVTSQGYFGPSCNMQSCCTANWVSTACNQSTGYKTVYDANNCPGNVSYQQACTYVTNQYSGSWSCTFTITDYAPGLPAPTDPKNYTEYWDCGGPGWPNGDSWTCSGTCTGTGVSCTANACVNAEPVVTVTNGVRGPMSYVCGINSQTCTFTGWR